MKQLTVITVTYNAARCIEKTLRSVIGQSVFDEQIEYIVIDGASTDGTLDILQPYRERLTHLVSEPDKGIYDAMNKGIRLASAPWICFMNADDAFFEPTTIEQLDLPSRAADRILYGDWIFVTPDGKQQPGTPNPFWQNPDKCAGIGFCHQATLVPTTWMQAMPFDTARYRYCNDYDFMFRCHKQGRCFEYVRQTLCLFEWGEGYSSNPRVGRRILDENARIAHCRYGYWYWRHRWRMLKKRLFRC